MIRSPRSTGCPTLMWKAWDEDDINVDLGYCRGTTVLRRVALKTEGCRALCVHSEGPARTANQGGSETSATDANQEACLRFCCRGVEELQNCRNGLFGRRG